MPEIDRWPGCPLCFFDLELDTRGVRAKIVGTPVRHFSQRTPGGSILIIGMLLPHFIEELQAAERYGRGGDVPVEGDTGRGDIPGDLGPSSNCFARGEFPAGSSGFLNVKNEAPSEATLPASRCQRGSSCRPRFGSLGGSQPKRS
ncbi:MAG: hypothetical protein ACYTFG_00220 [Planctomycetota bacterium]|jgi:hypothetical protein